MHQESSLTHPLPIYLIITYLYLYSVNLTNRAEFQFRFSLLAWSSTLPTPTGRCSYRSVTYTGITHQSEYQLLGGFQNIVDLGIEVQIHKPIQGLNPRCFDFLR